MIGGNGMSDHQLYMEEKNRLDVLLESGYQIKGVMENLSGTFVELNKEQETSEAIVQLHLTTANARKYVSVKLMGQSVL